MVRKRRTKIIATLGPATDDIQVLKELILAGADLLRVNFSHGDFAHHQKRVQQIRACAEELQREVAIIGDLQGPKIRIANFKNGKITLNNGDTFTLDAELADNNGDQTQVGIDYKQLPQDVKPNDILLLNDGLIELEVTDVVKQKIHCRVRSGGELSNHKGINRLGGGLSAKALTEKDLEDIRYAVQLGVDYLAVSFPRNAEDIHEARRLVQAAGGNMNIIAKIERTEAVAAIDDIIKASDAVMVARGDLGVEIGFAQVTGVQKHIIQRARSLDKAVITATQMMESMIHNAIPTRAEVSDVANAVLDGTDAVMLSAETAVGEHPAKVVASMADICLGAEKNSITQISNHRIEVTFRSVDEAIAMATMYTANHLNTVKAIISLTESGATPLWMSRIRSGIPIYALSRNVATLRKMLLFRGVYPVPFDPTLIDRREVNQLAIDKIKALGFVTKDDLVIITKGNSMGEMGGTNAMKIVRVE
ncbi:MAG: pyruvate kinase [Proteobacteria bacterium]|nr:pyruvate kinase [Pseudomonadota bacterium]